MLLILAALRHREQVAEADRPKVPVPVMFTLHGWDPVGQPVQDWLARRLGQTYPMLAGRDGAARPPRLLAEGKIAVILDGLDEIAADLRPAALRALSQQAAFRLVMLTRTAEMAPRPREGTLEGAAAIELRDMGAAPPPLPDPRPARPAAAGWRELVERLPRTRAPRSPGRWAPADPGPGPRHLPRPGRRPRAPRVRDPRTRVQSRDKIAGHLLDRVLPAAYAQQPGQPPPRYDLQRRSMRCASSPPG